jgi:hypothetical protein
VGLAQKGCPTSRQTDHSEHVIRVLEINTSMAAQTTLHLCRRWELLAWTSTVHRAASYISTRWRHV